MRKIIFKTAWAIRFLPILILPGSDLIKADGQFPLRGNIKTYQGQINRPDPELDSTQRLEKIFLRNLHPFSRSKIAAFSKHFLKLCKHHQLDPVFVLSVIDVESRFRVKARSEVGALGLMQIMPETARFIVDELDFHLSGLERWSPEKIDAELENEMIFTDPFVNTALGISYLAWLRDRYQGSPFHLLAAYYVGPARMDELLARKYFKPVQTQKYFNSVHQRVPRFRTALRNSAKPLECLVDLRRQGCYQEI
jgi:hypothetical protein